MCGIVGWVDFSRNLTGEQAALAAMTATMTCRGPDAGGAWASEHALIGHRRLAVVDLPGGVQPMSDASAVLTFSGEIYNFTELRRELQAHGHVFRTRSDTEVLLKAYACGIFPMAESADDPALYWIEPERRGIIPLDRFHIAGRLARTVRSGRFTVRVDRDFDAVLDGCADPMPGRTRTWINERIRTLYRKLYQRGDCHTVEVYEHDQLVGGLYGVSLGRAFFGESMFHRARDASKVALVGLVGLLHDEHADRRLLDVQWRTDHLASLGAVTIPRPAYLELLADAIDLPLPRPFR